MVFSSPVFLFFFLPVLLTAYFIAPRPARNGLLLAASLFFYAWGEPIIVFVMLASIGANYQFGLWVERARGGPGARRPVAAAIVFNLALLGGFKYANFLVDNLNGVLAMAGVEAIRMGPVPLPIGISFFTFQALSYVIDTYRGEARAERNPYNCALYISLFPQLIAGPIVRFRDIAAEIRQRVVHLEGFAQGVRRFIIGLAKKVLIANAAALPADLIFGMPAEDLSASLAWLGVICFTIQIYFDFSGYSDMAIGLGRMFGFHFRENFNYPYIADSMAGFWRRWHISLSTWFRDYLYIPLGGGRVEPARIYVNLIVVFILCGLWHGASWTYVIWGLYHGLFLIAERAGRSAGLGIPFRPLRHLYVALVFVVGWVFFRAETFSRAVLYLTAMAGLGPETRGVYDLALFLDPELILVLAAGLIGSAPVLPALLRAIERAIATRLPARRRRLAATAAGLAGLAALLALFLASAMKLSADAYTPFIYFRF